MSHAPRRLWLLVLLSAVTAHSAASITRHVSPDGSGTYTTIQAAIDASGSEDEVLLEDGAYTGDGNRDIDFHGKALTLRSASGNPQSCSIDCAGSPANPHRGFYFHSGESGDSRVEGLTVMSGDVMGVPGGYGGAVLCEAGTSPTFVNCRLVGNTAPSGGGIAAVNGAAPTLDHCTLSANYAAQGGGLYFSYPGDPTGPTVVDCVFEGNSADYYGGGGRSWLSNPTFQRCLFVGNEADGGGGLNFRNTTQDHPASVIDCVFTGNRVLERGGGMYCWMSDPILTSCTFSANEVSAFGGGGLACWDSNPTVESCTFWGNSCGTMVGDDRGGGVSCSGTSDPLLSHCIIAASPRGEAVYASSDSYPSLSCCDLHGNADGDWIGYIEGQRELNGNASVDPEFCSDRADEDRNWRLQSDSYCASGNNPACGLIGAWSVGCGVVPVIDCSWGKVRLLFR